MDTTALLAQLNEQAQNTDPIGATIKFEVDDHVVFIDGTGDSNVVSQENGDADCTITTSAAVSYTHLTLPTIYSV